MEIEDVKMTFADNLNYWLHKRNKTQADLYKRMGVSSATASDWCNAKKIPRTDKLLDIASWLMIELSDLLEVKERTDDNMNDIIFKLKDDSAFFEIVSNMNHCTPEELSKIADYIHLVSRRS